MGGMVPKTNCWVAAEMPFDSCVLILRQELSKSFHNGTKTRAIMGWTSTGPFAETFFITAGRHLMDLCVTLVIK